MLPPPWTFAAQERQQRKHLIEHNVNQASLAPLSFSPFPTLIPLAAGTMLRHAT